MRLPLVLALLLAAPAALAQEHEHGSGDGLAVVLHDGPADGRALVGSVTHFGFALIDHDGNPVVHRNAAFQVAQEGVVVFETNDTHEYDGMLSFDYSFTRPGPYVVTATSDKMATGVFEGVAVVPADPTNATVDFQRASGDASSNVVAGTLSILDADGKLLEHVDALVEFREKGSEKLAARVHMHVHDAPIEFAQGLGPATDYVMRVVAYNAYPTEGDAEFRAVVAEFPVTVGRVGLPSGLSVPNPPPLLSPQGPSATEDGLTLHGMYDPQNQVGVGQPIRLAGLVTNESLLPQAHVDFELSIKGPRGLVFSSKSLHEYDGMLEYLFTPEAPGLYETTMTADGKVSIPLRFQVVPPVAPIAGAGVGVVSVKGVEDLKAGVPTEVAFRVAGPQGAVQHSEVDVTVFHDDEAPIYQFKLHTHASGDTKAVLAFPHAGDWTIRVDPLPTVPQAVVFQGPKGPGQPIAFPVTVAAADDALPVGGAAAAGDAANAVPGVALPLALAALAAVALGARRRE